MHLDQSGCIKFSICLVVGSCGLRASEMTLKITLGEGLGCSIEPTEFILLDLSFSIYIFLYKYGGLSPCISYGYFL